MPNRPSRIVIPVWEPSYNGLYYPRWPNGDKPNTGAILAADALGVVASAAALSAQIRLAAATSVRSASTAGLSSAIRMQAAAADVASATGLLPAGGAGITVPGTPSGFKASTTSIWMSWGASIADEGVYQYRILARTGSNPFTQIGVSPIAAFIATGLSSSTSYDFKVVCEDEAGNLSSESAVGSKSTLATASRANYAQWISEVINTRYVLPSGNTWTAINTSSNSAAGTGTGNRTGCGFQYALNNAARGDIIELTADATYTGEFTLPEKSGTGWIYIRTSAHASLPTARNRVGAANYSHMPTIRAPSGGSSLRAVKTASRAAYYRFVGCAFGTSGQFVSAVVQVGDSETTLGDIPHHIFFDRCSYVEEATVGTRRVFSLNGTHCAVFDGYYPGVTDYGGDSDSQVAWATDSPGPLKFHNNFAEASGENFMTGGSDPVIDGVVPSDIQVTSNYFYKRHPWTGADNVKNHLELKSANRALVAANRCENMYNRGQSSTMSFKSTNQDGTTSNATVQDITVIWNRYVNVADGPKFLERNGEHTPETATTRVTFRDNVIETTGLDSGGTFTDSGRVLSIGGNPVDTIIEHNTGFIFSGAFTKALSLYSRTSDSQLLTLEDNIFYEGEYGIKNEDGGGSGQTALEYMFAGYSCIRNVFVANTGSAQSGYPTDNATGVTLAGVGFVGGTITATKSSIADYALHASSTYKGYASDGLDPGADVFRVAV